MAYPDLPPSETFWRCPHCGSDAAFRASGVGHVECIACSRASTVDQLKQAHAQAQPSPPKPTTPTVAT